jgi:cyclic pyranopterin phosphate synthase
MEKNETQLTDGYKRRLNYLRISITDRCNLRCMYCMPRKGVPKLHHADILSYEEILRLARIAAGLGIEKIRLTGGEPLVRKGVFEFLSRLAAIPGIRDLALTTNGVMLEDNLRRLRSAGLKRINVSLDSLRRDRYRKITGEDCLDRVWRAIHQARDLGFDPVRINMVVIDGLNDDEGIDFARLSLAYPYQIRFIEYMPMGTLNPRRPLTHVPSSKIKDMVAALGDLHAVSRDAFDGPARRYRFEGAPGEIGFISPISHHFCGICNRLRLTASGRLRPCLLYNRELDVIGPLRRGASDEALAGIFIQAAMNKPFAHSPAQEPDAAFSGQMWSIGG